MVAQRIVRLPSVAMLSILLLSLHLLYHPLLIVFIRAIIHLVVSSSHLSLLMHDLLLHLSVSHVPCELIHFVLVVAPSLTLGSLLALVLRVHPRFVRASVSLVSHLLFYFFSLVDFAKVGDAFGFFELLAHKPVVHCLDSLVVLVTFGLRDFEEFVLDLCLSLANQLALESLFCVFRFEPVLVSKTIAAVFAES